MALYYLGKSASQRSSALCNVGTKWPLRSQLNVMSHSLVLIKQGQKLFKLEYYITKILCPKIVLHSASKIEM